MAHQLFGRCSGGLAGTSPRCGGGSSAAGCVSLLSNSVQARHRRVIDEPQHFAVSMLSSRRATPQTFPSSLLRPRQATNSAVADAPAASTLSELPISPVVNPQGYIAPEVPVGTQASVFAIFDDKQKLQYVGFSKDFPNTLRTFFSRRPEKAFFYKVQTFQTLDQAAMISTRDKWLEEVGGAPPGNKLALERNAWQNPMDCGARSDRGKEGASLERLNEALAAIKARGCREEFIPDPDMYALGKIEFLPAVAQTDEVIAANKAKALATARMSRRSEALVDGEERPFSIFFSGKHATKGGYMFDVSVTFEDAQSRHRIIVAKEYYEPYDLEPESVVEAALALLFSQKEVRQTEGLLLSSQFPVNYFSMSGLEQWFGVAFAENFSRMTGKSFDAERDQYWRMNRIHDYAGKLDTVEQLSKSVGWHS